MKKICILVFVIINAVSASASTYVGTVTNVAGIRNYLEQAHYENSEYDNSKCLKEYIESSSFAILNATGGKIVKVEGLIKYDQKKQKTSYQLNVWREESGFFDSVTCGLKP